MRSSWFLVVALLMPSWAAAQMSVADGLQAMERGDYANAVRILAPLSEDPAHAEPVAQFLMGTLYSSGLGVQSNPIRACGLFLASAVPSNPLSTQALSLARLSHRDVPPLQQACVAASVNRASEPTNGGSEAGSDAHTNRARPDVPHADSLSMDPGVDALLRHDYARAASILVPIAESAERDVLASFLVAGMYQNGQGVEADLMRACAFYVRASHRRTPISRTAEDLVRSLRESMSVDRFHECVQVANTGFNHGFQPAQFSLRNGGWLRIDINGSTIFSNGIERQAAGNFGPEGSLYFPIRHAEIDAAPDHGGPRDFIHLFAWMPRGAGNWVLHWQLFEVVENNLIAIKRVELRTATGRRSDLDTAVDLDSLARVQLDAQGYAEWEVLVGPNAGHGTIETNTKQRKHVQFARAAADVNAQVSRTFSPHRRYCSSNATEISTLP